MGSTSSKLSATDRGKHAKLQSLEVEHIPLEHKTYKIVVLGKRKVGKTKFAKRIKSNEYTDEYQPTMRVEITLKTSRFHPERVSYVNIWDTPGEDLVDMSSYYFKGCDGVIIMTDMSDPTTLDSVQDYVQLLSDNYHAGEQKLVKWNSMLSILSRDREAGMKAEDLVLPVPGVLVANKCDLFEEHSREREDFLRSLKTLAVRFGFLDAYEISAKRDKDCYDVFKHLIIALRLVDVGHAPRQQAVVVFGIDLTKLAVRDRSPIPLFVDDLVSDYLMSVGSTEGLFRLTSSMDAVAELRMEIDRGLVPTLRDRIQDPHIAADLLKLYLMELPEPVIPFGQFSDFCNVASKSGMGEVQQLRRARALVDSMPSVHKRVLYAIVNLLHRIAMRKDRAYLTHVSLVFGSLLARPKIGVSTGKEFHTLAGKESKKKADVQRPMEYLIKNVEKVFRGLDLNTQDELFQELDDADNPLSGAKSALIGSIKRLNTQQRGTPSKTHTESWIFGSPAERNNSNSSSADGSLLEGSSVSDQRDSPGSDARRRAPVRKMGSVSFSQEVKEIGSISTSPPRVAPRRSLSPSSFIHHDTGAEVPPDAADDDLAEYGGTAAPQGRDIELEETLTSGSKTPCGEDDNDGDDDGDADEKNVDHAVEDVPGVVDAKPETDQVAPKGDESAAKDDAKPEGDDDKVDEAKDATAQSTLEQRGMYEDSSEDDESGCSSPEATRSRAPSSVPPLTIAAETPKRVDLAASVATPSAVFVGDRSSRLADNQ